MFDYEHKQIEHFHTNKIKANLFRFVFPCVGTGCSELLIIDQRNYLLKNLGHVNHCSVGTFQTYVRRCYENQAKQVASH